MSPDPSPETVASPPAGHFEPELRDAMLRVRGALMELLESIGADSSRPQDMARRFGINRNMAWKLSRIVHASDPTTKVGHLPGPAGLKILLETCARHRAPPAVAERVTQAMAAFDAVVARHAGDRAGLEVLLTAMATGEGAVDAQEPSRRQAFLGNAAIWGVQARLQFAMHIHVPSREHPGRVDAASISGLRDFQRLRPTARWPLMRLQGVRMEQGQVQTIPTEPLDPSAGPDGPPLVQAFSSIPPERLRAVEVPDGKVWELTEGPVGLTGSIDCTFARRARSVSSQWDTSGLGGATLMLPLHTPAEAVQLDMLIHRDLAYAANRPVAQLFSRMEGGPDVALSSSDRYVLPVVSQVEDLGAAPPALASPLAPRHAALAAWALDQLEVDADAFRAWRVVLSYPPLPSSPAMRVALPPVPVENG